MHKNKKGCVQPIFRTHPFRLRLYISATYDPRGRCSGAWRCLTSNDFAIAIFFYSLFYYLCIVIHWVTRYYIDESVIAFIPCSEIWKISNRSGEAITLVTRYWYTLWRILSPHSNTSVGYCLFDHGYSRTSEQIDDSTPHFLCI